MTWDVNPIGPNGRLSNQDANWPTAPSGDGPPSWVNGFNYAGAEIALTYPKPIELAKAAPAPNETLPTVVINPQDFFIIFGHEFSGTLEDIDKVFSAVADGRITAEAKFVDPLTTDRFVAPFDSAPSKIIFSGDSNNSTVSTVSSNFLQHITAFPVDGTRIDTIFNPDGSKVEKTIDQANQYDWDYKSIDIGIGGQVLNSVEVSDNGDISSVFWRNGDLTAGDVGTIFGSNLGRMLGGNNLVGQVAAGTLVGAIGHQIGDALRYGTTFSLDDVVNDAFGALAGGSGIGSLSGTAIGSLSSLLIGELADSLHLSGFEHGLFQSVGTTITAQLVTNAYNVTVLNAPASALFNGFDAGSLAFNISGAVGAYFGSYLAGQIVHANYQSGAIGGSIGSAVGAALGMSVLGPIGSFLGSFVGDLAGTLLGDLFGSAPHPSSYASLWLDPASHRFMIEPGSFGGYDGGDPTTLLQIANYQSAAVNTLLDLAGAQVDWHYITTGVATITEDYPVLTLLQRDHTYTMALTTTGLAQINVNNAADIAPLVDPGIMALVHDIHLAGGDPLVRLAWDNSHATNATAFALDLQFAHDYRAYLDDKDTIDALMAAEPDSAFTAGWVLTLLKARELGLDAAPASDAFRDGNDTLAGTANADHLLGGGGNDTLSGGAGDDRLDGEAGNDTLAGGDGNDILLGGGGADAMSGGAGDDSYYVDSQADVVIENPGEGTDTVYASATYALPANSEVENLTLLEGAGAINGTGNALQNTIIGNSSDNVLSGGGGDDQLFGGDGNDTLGGGAGDDHLSGGNGNDLMSGGDGDDTYDVTEAGDQVSEGPGQGYDTVLASVSLSLPANVEQLTMTGTDDLDAVANAQGDTLIGNAGDNRFTVGAGSDLILGGAGIDTVVFSGNRADYAISYDGTDTQYFTVIDLRSGSPDGTDIVGGVEFFAFANATVDTLSLSAQTVNNPDGTSTVTAYDVTGGLPWWSRVSTYDAANHLAEEKFNEDNGTVWSNAYDTGNASDWAWSTSNVDGTGYLVSKVTTYDDGTHALEAHDVTGANDWSDVTIQFDAGWNIVTQSGARHDGTPLSASDIGPISETVAWYAHPVDPARDFVLH